MAMKMDRRAFLKTSAAMAVAVSMTPYSKIRPKSESLVTFM